MLKSTFCHFPNIGPKRETLLWSKRIFTWEKLMNRLIFKKDIGFKVLSDLQYDIVFSIERYIDKDPKYFESKLPSNQLWRIFPDFRDFVAYIDIETTGLYIPTITTIALYDGHNIKYYVNGINLDEFKKDIFNYKVIITYNGKCFDVPIIESHFRIKLDHVHIDLRYLLKSLGYSGGLKGCEKQLGLSRGDLEDVDGHLAVLLWNEYYSNKNKKALDTLLAYNIEDVVNLERLMVIAFNKKIQSVKRISIKKMLRPQKPVIPFKPDRKTIEYVKKQHLENRIYY